MIVSRAMAYPNNKQGVIQFVRAETIYKKWNPSDIKVVADAQHPGVWMVLNDKAKIALVIYLHTNDFEDTDYAHAKAKYGHLASSRTTPLGNLIAEARSQTK